MVIAVVGRRKRVPYLPCEMVYEIMLRLPAESLAKYKRVCKSWYGIIRSPDFIELQLVQSRLQRHRRHVLISCKNRPSIYSLVEEGEYEWRAIKETLSERLQVGLRLYIAGSCNGLLCISPYLRRSDPVFICNLATQECVELTASKYPIMVSNPFTGKQISVPKRYSEFPFWHQEIGFGYDAVSKKYKWVRVYFVYVDKELGSAGEIMTTGEHLWRRLEFPRLLHLSYQPETLYVAGSFYWVINNVRDSSCRDDILAFEIHNEKFSTMEYPPSVKRETNRNYSVLMNLGGFLSLIDDISCRVEIRIWQMMDNIWTCRYTLMTRWFTSLGMNIGENILLQIIGTNDELVVYDTTWGEGFEIEVSGRPTSFQASSVLPSLVSPKAIINGISK